MLLFDITDILNIGLIIDFYNMDEEKKCGCGPDCDCGPDCSSGDSECQCNKDCDCGSDDKQES